MYKFSKLESQAFKHHLNIHKGKEDANCRICQNYKKKIGNNKMEAEYVNR